MSIVYDRVKRSFDSITDIIPFKPKIGLVLGSGLGDFADDFEKEAVIEYADIADFPRSTNPAHKGRYVFTHIHDVPVVMMQGRIHFYEGYTMEDVVLPTRLMKLMGADILFLTNAAGGVNISFEPGTLMLITDHISTFVPNPLVGPNADELGLRFPDMSFVYNKYLCTDIRQAGIEMDVPLSEGVYMQLTGPSYETPAEIRMARALGADAVGMSTVVEAMAANHMGMKVCGLSVITNLAAGMTDEPLSDEEVQEVAWKVSSMFKGLVTDSIRRIGNNPVYWQ